MTGDLADKLEYLEAMEHDLESIDLAPSTSATDFCRAAVSADLRKRDDGYSLAFNDRKLIEADIVDERCLCLRLGALRFYRELAECPDQSLIDTVVQRAIAELKHCFDQASRNMAWEADRRSLMAMLELRTPGDCLNGCSKKHIGSTISLAEMFTHRRINMFEDHIDFVGEWELDYWSDDHPFAMARGIVFPQWINEDKLRAKYRNGFRYYLAEEHNL